METFESNTKVSAGSVADDLVNVELVYALPEQQTLLSFTVPKGTTLAQGITLSMIQDHYPDLDVASLKAGLFGKIAPGTQVLRDKDRIELYRPLIADPKEVRKQRAEAGKKMKKGGDKGAAA
ncbi:MAG: RnfH family protein [Proteobacteria bacterium]|nr:MAG: RnfH family protein [Pseudomonadota bacterium]